MLRLVAGRVAHCRCSPCFSSRSSSSRSSRCCRATSPSRILGPRRHAGERSPPCASSCSLDEPAPQRYLRWLGGILQRRFRQRADQPSAGHRDPGAARSSTRSCCRRSLSSSMCRCAADPGDASRPLRRDRPIDHVLSVITLVLLSMPDFLLGTLLLIAFVGRVPLFPAMSSWSTTSSGHGRVSARHARCRR